jgi:hypothetical protein
MLFKNPVRTSKRTPHFTITKINWLTLFKEMIAVYSEKHTKHINTKCRVIVGSQGSSVSNYGLDDLAIGVRSPAEEKIFL